MSKKLTEELPGIRAYPMSTMTFLYEFMDIIEFNELKKEFEKVGLYPTILVFPDKVDIWLLSE